MNKEIFPPEIIQYTSEYHFAKHYTKTRIIYGFTILVILLFFLATPFIPIEITTQSRGIVRSPNENNKLQTTVYGEISYSNIVENKLVKCGDTLLKLRTDKIDEQLNAANAKRQDNLNVIRDINLLMANKSPIGYKYLGEYNELVTKKEELTTQVLYAERELKRAELLFKKNVLSESDYLQEKNKYEIALRQLNFAVNEYRNRWQTEKKRLELENVDLTSTVLQLNKEKRNYVIVAPTDGSIIQSTDLQAGNFITPGQVIASLSQDEHLIAECYIKPSDIGFVRVGSTVAFQFDAFNYREWGMISGKVSEISNDVILQNDKETVFRVRCLLDKKYLTLKNGYRGNIKKGMTLTGQFFLTRRTLAQLLFDKMDDWMNPKLVKLP